jgi:uncharacterized protein with GYD domain
MATYVILSNFTDQGARTIKDTVTRAEAAQKVAKEFGVTFKALYWTQGQYDLVAVTEGPDEQAAAALSLMTASLGNVRSQTLRAFDATEMKAIIAKMK